MVYNIYVMICILYVLYSDVYKRQMMGSSEEEDTLYAGQLHYIDGQGNLCVVAKGSATVDVYKRQAQSCAAAPKFATPGPMPTAPPSRCG